MGTARIETRARKRTQPPRFLTSLPTKKETIECKGGGVRCSEQARMHAKN